MYNPKSTLSIPYTTSPSTRTAHPDWDPTSQSVPSPQPAQVQHSHRAACPPSQIEYPSQATTCQASAPRAGRPRRVLVAARSGVRRFLKAGGNASVRGLGLGLGVETVVEWGPVPVPVSVPGLVARLSRQRADGVCGLAGERPGAGEAERGAVMPWQSRWKYL